MHTLLLLLVVGPLLGSGVVACLLALALTLAWLPRLWLGRRSRSLESAATGG